MGPIDLLEVCQKVAELPKSLILILN